MVLFAEGLVLLILYFAEFPEADALIKELAVVLLQFAVGLPEVGVLQVVVGASLGGGKLFRRVGLIEL